MVDRWKLEVVLWPSFWLWYRGKVGLVMVEPWYVEVPMSNDAA